MTYYNNEVDDDVANEEELRTFSEMRTLSETTSWGNMGGDDPYTGRSTSKNRENSFSLEEEIVVKDDTKPTASATSKGISKANFNCDVSYIEHMNAFASKLIITESVIRISIKNEKEAGNHPISNKRIQEDEKYGVSLRPHAVQEWSLKLIKGITKRRYEMCHSAVEVYFIDKTSIMLDFEKTLIAKSFSNLSKRQTPRTIRIDQALYHL